MRSALVLLAFCATTAPALAQVTSIAPFTGALRESFEFVPTTISGCLAPQLFEGEAQLCAAPTTVFDTGQWTYFSHSSPNGTSECTVYPRAGQRQFGLYDSNFELAFDRPMQRFGGWFAHGVGASAPVDTFELLDEQGAVVFTQIVAFDFDCTWRWVGWDAGSTPIKTLRLNPASLGQTPPIIADDWHADFAPQSYCTAGATSSGCTASLTATRAPDTAHSAPCSLSVLGVEGQRVGIVFYALSPQSAPWCAGGSSMLCVELPVQRTGVQNSGGTSGACDGVFTLDWNAFQLAQPSALGNPWDAGDTAYVQAWFRDPLSCRTTSLSDALALTYSTP
jgi:hypothetical protein